MAGVCVSLLSRHCIKTDERIEMVFGTKASLELSYTAPKKFWYIRKNGTSQELCRELCTKNFRHYFRAVTD